MANKSVYRAAIYIRVSTEEQASEGQSPQAQEGVLRQYCIAYNIEVYDIYMDLGISGKSLRKRQELARLIEDSRKKMFDIVLVWKISRLSRNLRDLLYIIDVLESNNVHFASYSEKFDTTTPVGRMTLQLLGSIAEFERNTIVENVKLGLSEFARKGGKASSVLGYDNIGKKLRINENEADTVRLIFNLYVNNGLGYSAIAEHLNNMGLRTKRDCIYRSSSISYIIGNPVYIGINRHRIKTENEYLVENTHPAIIACDLWNKAQKISGHNNRIRNSASPRQFPFPVVCLQCNSTMKIFYAFSKGKKYKYLRCRKCSNYVNIEKLKKEINRTINAVFDDKTSNKAACDLIKRGTAEFGCYPMLLPTVPEIELKDYIYASEPAALSQIYSYLIKYINAYRDYINIVLYL